MCSRKSSSLQITSGKIWISTNLQNNFYAYPLPSTFLHPLECIWLAETSLFLYDYLQPWQFSLGLFFFSKSVLALSLNQNTNSLRNGTLIWAKLQILISLISFIVIWQPLQTWFNSIYVICTPEITENSFLLLSNCSFVFKTICGPSNLYFPNQQHALSYLLHQNLTCRTFLVVQWLLDCTSCREHRIDPWLGN